MKREFLREMQFQYDRRVLVSDRLGKKASDLTTVSVIMIAAITAFYGHMWSVVEQGGILFHSPMISVMILGFTALLCVRSSGEEFQRMVFLGGKITEGSGLNESVVKSWTDVRDVFYASLIKEYALCLREAESIIEKKAASLTRNIKLFSAGCVTFPIWVVLALLA